MILISDIQEKLQIFTYYMENSDKNGTEFIDGLYIKSNDYYVFFMDNINIGHTFALFSKKYYITIELTKDKGVIGVLDKISDVINKYREEKNLEIVKFQFWLPHCYVNNQLVQTKLLAESYGVTCELALEYLLEYDDVFQKLYNTKSRTYFGLPLFETYEEAEEYVLKDNSKEYIKGLKKLKRILNT